jgi:hypothetical protein
MANLKRQQVRQGRGMTVRRPVQWFMTAMLGVGLAVSLVPLAAAQSSGDSQTISLTPPSPADDAAPQLNDDGSGGDEGDQHAGYYYPKPQTLEHYTSSAPTLADSDKVRRQGFVIGLTKQLMGGQYAPSYAIFAKGNQSDKLIIIGLVDGQLNTIYRARALLASLTSIARATNFFQQTTHPEEATFFDLMKLLGFRRLTISDGKTFAHQILID